MSTFHTTSVLADIDDELVLSVSIINLPDVNAWPNPANAREPTSSDQALMDQFQWLRDGRGGKQLPGGYPLQDREAPIQHP
jgi:hypothetical protein